MLTFLLALIEPFRFMKHSREHQVYLAQWDLRVATERAEQALAKSKLEQEHQLRLAQVFMDGLASMQEASRDESKSNADALIALAHSQAKHAESFSDWLKLFQSSPAPSSSTVRPEDELWLEQQKLMEAGMPVELAELPEELKLAWALQNDPNWMDIGPLKP